MTISADDLSKIVDCAADYCRDPVLLAQLRLDAMRLRVLGDREYDAAQKLKSARAA